MEKVPLFLAADCGNTHIKLGVFSGDELKANFRLTTDPQRTSDEYAVILRSLLAGENLDLSRFEGAVLATVVPPVQPLLARALTKVLTCPCLVVSPETDAGISVDVDDPGEVGADLVCLAAGAARRYPLPSIVVSFGTATAILALDASASLVGVAIAPGILGSARSLHASTAKLPDVDVATPKRALGRNTVEALRAGLVFGFAGLVERIVREMERELGTPVTVIATGGLLNVLAPVTTVFHHFDAFLPLHGLRAIWERR